MGSNFDYKEYSLENLENWMHDAMSSSNASPQEIYDVIVGVVKENYCVYKEQASQAYELLSLLNGNDEDVKKHLYETYDGWDQIAKEVKATGELWDKEDKILSCDKDDNSPECQKSWNDFWEDSMPPWGHSDLEALSKPKKWILPVELDGLTGECYINLPDDLLEVANLKEGDQVEWIDRKDGSFEFKKVNKPLGIEDC